MGLEQAEGTLGFGAGMLTNVALTGAAVSQADRILRAKKARARRKAVA